MVFLVGVEMGASGRETRGFALSGLMDVRRVLSGGKVLNVQLDHYAGATFGLSQCGSADTLILGIFEFDGYRFGRGVPCGDSEKTHNDNGESLVSHSLPPLMKWSHEISTVVGCLPLLQTQAARFEFVSLDRDRRSRLQ
jgi:hypothetical protein